MAPGDNLDFYESAAFAARVEENDAVRTAIHQHLRNSLRAEKPVCGPLYTLELTVAGRGLAYIYGRKGQRVNIAYVFEMPDEAAAFGVRLAEMRKLYCADSEGRKP